jgi:FdrA protein
MFDHVEIRRGSYHDSVTLMLVSKQLAARDDVEIASIGSGTPLNVELVTEQGFVLPGDVGPNDLMIALRLTEESVVPVALATVDELLRPPRAEEGAGPRQQPPVSVRSAVRRRPEGNLAVLSVPRHGLEFEIASSLDAGLNVFCFSDGLSIEAERHYKELAVSRGLLLMGPDCGTAILDGVGLGFANVVRSGPVGIVGASGTGIQEVTCLLHRSRVGVSQVYGVGGRDLKGPIGGVMTLDAVRRLADDPATETVLVISKPPDPTVAERVAAAVRDCGRPAALCFLGSELKEIDGVPVLSTLEEGARWAVEQQGGSWPEQSEAVEPAEVVSGDLHGLFTGGTLAYEAMTTLVDRLGPISSNTPLDPAWRLADPLSPSGNCVVDFGEDELTEGRAHPMIDPALRLAAFDASAADPAVGVVLMDLVLGHGSHEDPAAELAEHVRAARQARPGGLAVVVSVCGTELDPQGADGQAAILRDAGARVTWSAAAAARLALGYLGKDRR